MTSDISVYGGVGGKVYRGGRFLMEQAPVEPGIWLPVRFEVDITGRKFLFGFTQHEVTQITAYRRIGPPEQALAAVRHELSNGGAPQPAQ
jgi:hypothetical protein